MAFDLRESILQAIGSNYELHAKHVNPQFARVLKTIGYDHVYVRAQGPYLWDDAGRQYLDFLSGYAVCNMGRNHPIIRKALADYLSLDFPSMVQFEAPLLSGMLASELKRRTNRPDDCVFFTNSGTEGIEAAIKFAKCATGRPGIIAAQKAFHGLTTGALSINGCESFTSGFGPHMPGARSIPFDDLRALRNELARGDVAAFIVEPIQGKGVNMPSPGYLVEAARLCRQQGALFVADEVQTGVGRTGSFLAIDQESVGGEGVNPDMIVMSKALSGGYVPVGAVLTRRSVWSKVFSSMDRAIVHSSTFHQGSLAMVAGLASLAVYDEERLDENARRMGEILLQGLDALRGRFEFIREVRGRGLMLAVEFGEPRSLSLKAGWKIVQAMDRNLFAQAVVIPLMADHRILCQVAGHNQAVVKLIPPLCISEADVAWFLRSFEEVMVRLHRFPGPAFDVLKRLGSNTIGSRERDIDGAIASVGGPSLVVPVNGPAIGQV